MHIILSDSSSCIWLCKNRNTSIIQPCTVPVIPWDPAPFDESPSFTSTICNTYFLTHLFICSTPEHKIQKQQCCSSNAVFNYLLTLHAFFSGFPKFIPNISLPAVIQHTVNYLVNNEDMLKLYWQAGITPPLFQMAQEI